MKKMILIIISVSLIFSFSSLSAVAWDRQEVSDLDTYNTKKDIKIQYDYEYDRNKINIDISISWGDMRFYYQPDKSVWNPQTLKYENSDSGKWIPATKNSNKITVLNRSANRTQLRMSVKDNPNIKLSFLGENGYNMPYYGYFPIYESMREHVFYLQLSGVNYTSKEKDFQLGTLTLKLGR